jgi:amidase
MRSCTLISATGCPALSVPGGFTPDGLPVGLQIIGPPRADRKVLEVGHAFEQATGFGARRPAL